MLNEYKESRRQSKFREENRREDRPVEIRLKGQQVVFDLSPGYSKEIKMQKIYPHGKI